MNILISRGVWGHAPPRKFEIFRSSKTASTGSAPKTRILLILSLSMGMHPYSGTTNIVLHAVHAAKIGSA